MTKLISTGIFLLATLGLLGAQNVLHEAQTLYRAEKYSEAQALLEKLLPSVNGREKAAVLVALSKTTLKLGDDMKFAGATQPQLLAQFEKGENYAKSAISLDPSSAEAWYWKSSNVGRWAQTKGVLDSLFRAGDMKADMEKTLSLNPNHADSHYVLGIMYEALPGWPVSFGNPSWAVSFGRKAVALMETEVNSGQLDQISWDFYIELAKHLWARNWDENKRQSEQSVQRSELGKAGSALEKSARFEATVTLSRQADRVEAKALVEKALKGLESIAMRTRAQARDLQKAQKLLADWK